MGSDVTVAETPAVKTPTKASKATKAKATKIPKVKVVAAHPPFINMITEAVSNLKDRKGSSRVAIFKFITAKYTLGDQVNKTNAHLRSALKKGVVSKVLVQTNGIGANGRFRLAVAEKPPAVKKAATGEQKVMKTVAKKAVSGDKAKKTVAKKTGDKVKKVKSPKRIAKPAVKKVTKKAAAPTKSAANETAPKKAAATEAAPKKAAVTKAATKKTPARKAVGTAPKA